MRTRSAVLLTCCLFCGVGFASPSRAQQACQPPPAVAARGKSIFTDQQENDLGDAIAESLQHDYRVIDDDDYTGYLQRVGARLLKHVPPNELHFQFLLFDLPTANAFSLPGGRVLVSRKLISFIHSEDELAGVLGHEIGHSIVHESAADVSRAMQVVLGVTTVGDRQDVYDKFNQLIENLAKKRNVLAGGRNTEEQAQLIADRIAVYAMAAAGYDPNTFSQFWDRFAQTKGKTGGFLSDLFGATSPESRRLREMLSELGRMPQACIDARQKTSSDDFKK
jgi:predicted Zn-dependent protease